ncbi:2Fe-2S iron-sulfur cluster-binding protein [Rhodococcus opacus]|uniref:PDR/VanB family oxidoreductase n=1 Tax=Rhodococcus opacus TaxID=37919 RepID=UPI0034D1F1CA
MTIAVLREPASRGGSAYLHDGITVGDVLDIGEIRNNFPLVGAPEYVFVAGGIGITPLIPMIERANATGTPWRLVYGGRSRRSMAYIDHLVQYGSSVAIRPEDECGLLNFEVDVTAGLREGGVVFACGPEPMLSALEKHCLKRSVPLHIERFRASEETLVGTGINKPFVCKLARTGKRIEVTEDETIVGALERCGIFPKSDCREGTCGSCETAVLSGGVEHRDALLDENERVESKTMMICVSRATTDEIVLDL